jgi:hypothetical protein
MLSHRSPLVVLSVLGAAASSAGAAPWIEPLTPGFYVTDLSYDGTAAAGNITADWSYETFRWTRDSGVIPLGRGSIPALGVGGGSPDISYNGDRVSAMIVTEDGTMATLGRWTLDEGWQEAFVPLPSFVVIQDQACSSAWGLSGDGAYVCGYYLNTTTGVQPCAWSPTLPLIDLPTTPGLRGRANAASYDSSVVVGWEDQGLGPWVPTAWRSGVKYPLGPSLGSTMAQSVSTDGSIVVGYGPDEFEGMQAATIWRWNGSSYDAQIAGYLPDTVYGWGQSQFSGVTDDGLMAVGSNRLAFNPNLGVRAIIWTPQTGLVNGTDYLSLIGLELPENFELRDFQAVSPDGSVIAAAGINSEFGMFQTILIHLQEPCAADFNSDRQVEDSDFVLFANAYDILDCSEPGMPLRCPSDINRDGMVDDADFVLFASAYDALLCP